MKNGFGPQEIGIREFGLNLRYAPELNLVYLNNPKCACSTVKASIWQKIDEINGTSDFHPRRVHSQQAYRSIRLVKSENEVDQFISATKFSVVRNPYRRALSAYLNKIGRDRKDQRIWKIVCNRYGLRNELTSSEFRLRDFISILIDDRRPPMDPHYRPQFLNLFWGNMRWDYVAHLEQPDEINSFLQERGMQLHTVDHHKTGARTQIQEYYDEETAKIVYEMYKEDFEYFGYSEDLSEESPTSPVKYIDSDDAVENALRSVPAAPITEDDTVDTKIRKAGKFGKKLEVIASVRDQELKYYETLVCLNLINTAVEREKSKSMDLDLLVDLQKEFYAKKISAHQKQFGHLNPDFFEEEYRP